MELTEKQHNRLHILRDTNRRLDIELQKALVCWGTPEFDAMFYGALERQEAIVAELVAVYGVEI